jgi:AbiV family abortive infection protein
MLDESRARELEKEIQQKLVAKDQLRRFKQYVEVQNDLLSTGKSLVSAGSREAANENFKRVAGHGEGLWDDACVLFLRERYATALAISVTCLEEVGKLGVARFELALQDVLPGRPLRTPTRVFARSKKHPFYSHTQKLLLAAGAGALVNARLDRILGLSEVVAFLRQVEQGTIEHLRQSCLYSDADRGKLLLPFDQIDRKKAQFYVILAGELLAEVAGFEPPEFRRLLTRVQEFEKRTGHTYK